MKKFLFTAVTALALTSISAQTPFLTKTCYRGAFAPAPAPMWTDTWTEWDPQNKVYPAPTVTVSADISTNTTWSTGQVVLLQGPIYVKNNSVLTIQPGVIIRGSKVPTGTGLFITTGSQLNAVGTVANPIVFTSDQPVGSRGLGDWGGVILMGLADNNNPGGTNYIEGITPGPLTLYGGGTTPNDNDNSGNLQYIRIEYGGYIYAPNKEINGLTFGAVGRGTTIDHIQVSYSNDDAYEWFGGSVQCKHLVAYRCLDDDWDTDNGFHGVVQFCLGVRDPAISDNPTISTSEGFESDNDPNGTTTTPLTTAIFSNVTDIGPLRGVLTATYASGFRRGARIRRNSNLKIINSILMDHATRGCMIDGTLSEANANANTLLFRNNIVAGYGQVAMETTTTTSNITPSPVIWIGSMNDTLKSSANILTTPYNYFAPDYRPAAGSLALSGASFTNALITVATGTTATTVMATLPATLCVGNSTSTVPTNFVASTTLSPEYCSLSWSVSPGITISSTAAVNPSFTVSTIGTFSVYLMVSTADGNTVVINALTTATCGDVSIKEAKNQIGLVSIYPNPASSELTTLVINTNVASTLNVSISDITGKVISVPVQNQNLVSGENKLTLSTAELNNGIYFVTLNTHNGKETVKLIVNK